MEIEEAAKDDVMSGEIAKTVFETASNDIKEPEFVASLLEVASEFEDIIKNDDEDSRLSKVIER